MIYFVIKACKSIILLFFKRNVYLNEAKEFEEDLEILKCSNNSKLFVFY
jgi:hypothetical protein